MMILRAINQSFALFERLDNCFDQRTVLVPEPVVSANKWLFFDGPVYRYYYYLSIRCGPKSQNSMSVVRVQNIPEISCAPIIGSKPDMRK